MPAEVGPGKYDIERAENYTGKKRKDFCISKVVPIITYP
jgi:hypothetical protein